MRKLRDNGLTIALIFLFAFSIVGHTLAGWANFNESQEDHEAPRVSLGEYIASGDFSESVFENWESEFLQMGMYVVLTAVLFQRGSPESRDPDGEEPTEIEPGEKPWAVKKGGVWLTLYRHSLSIALFSLFIVSWLAHAVGGMKAYNHERAFEGDPPVSLGDFMQSSRFWFESFQNWQSEFLSVAVLVILSIYLREDKSSQSKPVEAPHSQTK